MLALGLCAQLCGCTCFITGFEFPASCLLIRTRGVFQASCPATGIGSSPTHSGCHMVLMGLRARCYHPGQASCPAWRAGFCWKLVQTGGLLMSAPSFRIKAPRLQSWVHTPEERQDWGGGPDHPARGFCWAAKFNLCGMGLWTMMCCQEQKPAVC